MGYPLFFMVHGTVLGRDRSLIEGSYSDGTGTAGQVKGHVCFDELPLFPDEGACRSHCDAF
jgi:hypothetical protein